jgi:aminoglycoside 6'-N-acetyltransferase I
MHPNKSELRVRNHAEGSKSRKIPSIEGWYVNKDLRGSEYGKQLQRAAEMWAIENGFDELSSDTELENPDSVAAYEAMGFEEVE